MKLRKKKTGEIEYLLFNSCPVSGDIVLEYMDENAESGYSEYCRYSSLAELNEDWEDYRPKESLIKDEKIRKAVRAWAEANEIGPQEIIRFNAIEHRLSWISTAIEFNEFEALSDLEKENYTIAELCGEEEE